MKKEVMRVYYGDGKGKSAAAIGKAVMEANEGHNVIIIQFLKGRSEQKHSIFDKLEPEIKLFRFEKSEICFADLTEQQQKEEKMNLRNGVNFARKVLTTGECDMLILDEILGLLENDIITIEELAQFKQLAVEGETELILTGNHNQAGVTELADTVYQLETRKES